MKTKLLILYLFILFSNNSFAQLIQGTIKPGATTNDFEIWLKPDFSNSTQFLSQIGLPISFPSSTIPQPTGLNVTLDPGFIASFGSNYSIVLNPIAHNTANTEDYYNIVLIRGGVGASDPQTWTAGTEFKVLSATFTYSGPSATFQPSLADYQDGGSDGLGQFYTVDGNATYYITSNSIGNFYVVPGVSILGGNASAGYIQVIASTCTSPTTPAVTNITNNSADISWTAVPGSAGYEYAISTSSTPPLTGTSTSLTSFSASSLLDATIYYVFIRNDCSAGSFSPWVSTSFTTLGTPCPPPLPTASNITTTSTDLNWPSLLGAVNYEYTIDQIITSPVTGTTTTNNFFNATTLASGTTYYFHVRTNCSAGSPSAWVTISFNTACESAPIPVISNITAEAATATWLTVLNITGYEFAITTSPTPPAAGSYTSDTTFDFTGLLPGTLYYVYIRTGCNTGDFSAWASASFTSLCKEPTAPVITNITTSADISWVDVGGTAVGYEYAITTDSITPMSGTFTTSTAIQATGLQSYTTYYVHIRTSCGTGGFSNWIWASFTTDCYKPELFVISNSSQLGTARLGWHDVHGATNYEYAILRTAAPPGGSLAFTTDTTLDVGNLQQGIKYYLHVRTHCGPASLSDWSTLEFFTSGLAVYPNPANDIITIHLIDGTISNEEILIVDAIGRIVKKARLSNNTTTINISNLATGVYFVRYSKNKHYTTPILKK